MGQVYITRPAAGAATAGALSSAMPHFGQSPGVALATPGHMEQ
jgi:hypothetical protein